MRRVGVGLVRSVSADEDHPFVDEVPCEELEQVPCRVVSPVKVLDADDHRAIRGERPDQVEHATKRRLPPASRRSSGGHDASRSIIRERVRNGPTHLAQ